MTRRGPIAGKRTGGGAAGPGVEAGAGPPEGGEPMPIMITDPTLVRFFARIDTLRGAPVEHVHAETLAAVAALQADVQAAEHARRFPASTRLAPDLGGAITRLVNVDAAARQEAERVQQAEAQRAALAPVAAKARKILDELVVLQAGPQGTAHARLDSIDGNELRKQLRQSSWYKVDRLERLRRDLRSSATNTVILLTRIEPRLAKFSVKELTQTAERPTAAEVIVADVKAASEVPRALEAGLAEAAGLIEDIAKEIASAPPPKYLELDREPTEHPMPIQTVR